MTGFAQTATPRNLSDFTDMISRFRGKISIVAGGTDLVIALAQGPLPDLFIDISQMDELNFVDMGDDVVRIGAATTMSVLAEHNALLANFPALAQAAIQMGSVQIRNRATIGGNIASAVPAGDLLPVLKCFDCRIEVLHPDKTVTTRGFDDVVTGLGKNCLGNGELITAINIPSLFGKNRISAFGKIGRRQELTIARLNLAVVADYDPQNNRIDDIRIVAGAIAPLPLRLQLAEQKLRGRTVDQSLADDFLLALTDAVDVAIPGRYSQSYKRHAVMGLGLDVLASLFGKEFMVSKQSKELA